MIANLWAKVPAEEQKLILGAVAAVLAAGALHITGQGKYGFTVDTGIVVTALLRYITDRLGAVVATPAPSTPPVPPVVAP